MIQREVVQVPAPVDASADVDALTRDLKETHKQLAKVDAEKVEFYRKFLQEELANSKLQQELEQVKRLHKSW